VAFEGARVLVGDGRVIDRATILVENERLLSIGPATQVREPANVTRIDLSGKTVMPSLIDAHIHIGYENLSSWKAENYTRENVISTLERLAWFGVGAVLSTGSDPIDIADRIVRDQAAGTIGGARFVYAAGFGPPGQGPNAQLLAELAKFPTPVVRGITGEADARQGVREVAARNVRFVKVWVTDRNGTQTKTVPEAYRALIDEAHRHDIRALAHATDSLADAKDLARAGLDGSLHAVPDADAEFAALMKRNNAFLAPTQGFALRGSIPGSEPWFEDPLFRDGTPAATLARYRQQAAAQTPAADAQPLAARLSRVAPMIKTLLAANVRIVVGTDAGAGADYPPGYPVHREMELYTRIGMTPEQVITAATKSGAEALRLDKDLGTLEAGKLASFLVLDADPRTDIRNTRRIARVYLAGKEVDRQTLRATK